VAAVFPRVARRADWSDADARAAALSIRFVVVLCLGAVAVAVLAAGPLAGLFFESEPPGAERAIILGLGAVAASGLTLQLSSVLVAVRSERLILGASAAGAAVIVAGCTVAVVVAARDAAVSVMVAFAVAQTLTAVLLWRKARRATALPRSTLALACTVSVALPPAAALAAWVTDARIPVGVACGAGCAVLAGRTAQAVMARSRST
jgi:O-antigen/teichoic acid export membrane protein